MIRLIAFVIVMAVAYGIAGTHDFEEEQRQEQEYCDMVKLYKQTIGQAGWPEYRKGEIFCQTTHKEQQK